MRKPLAAFAVVVVALWTGATPASAARPPVVRAYEGTTSAGDVIRMYAIAQGGEVRFQGVGLEGAAPCEDGTAPPFAHGIDAGPEGIPLVNGALELHDVAFSQAFFLSGTLGTRAGSGTITHLFAALDADEDAQLCSTGEQTWTVTRVPMTGVARRTAALLATPVRGVTETANLEPGRRAPAPDAAARLRLRSYEGRTSAGAPMSIATGKRGGAVQLFDLGIGWELACEDTSSITLGFFILFAGEPLEPGRLDYDVAAPELALHVNGRLGPHAGEGTTSGVVPALTADLEAQACRSGELTWRAWRIDPGALV
jgi:hypothetical protein